MAQTEDQRKRAAYMREYTRQNKERINAQRRDRRKKMNYLAREKQWRAANRDKVLDYKRADRERRPQDYKQWKKEWREKHAARLRERKRADYARNKPAILARLQQHRRSNPDNARETMKRYCAKRRARIAKVPYERIDRRTIYRRDDRRCWICKHYVRWTDFSLDHVVPISKGGAHIESNVKTAHINCNRKRGARDPIQTGLGLCG